jgi:hypothetical protein
LLRRWLRDERNRSINVKRDAEVALQPWHEMEADDTVGLHASAETPENAFDRLWVETLVTRSMAAIAQRWKNRAEFFAALRETVESSGNVENAARLGMTCACNLRDSSVRKWQTPWRGMRMSRENYATW